MLKHVRLRCTAARGLSSDGARGSEDLATSCARHAFKGPASLCAGGQPQYDDQIVVSLPEGCPWSLGALQAARNRRGSDVNAVASRQ